MGEGLHTPPPFQDLLDKGERVVWHGQPGARALFFSELPRLAVIALLLGLALALLLLSLTAPFGVMWEAALLFSLLTALAGWRLHRAWREAKGAAVSHYVITNRRLILILPCIALLKGPLSIQLRRAGLEDRDDTLFLAGAKRIGRVRDGRSTVHVMAQGVIGGCLFSFRFGWRFASPYSGRSRRLYGFDLIDISDPDEVLALLDRVA